MQGPETLFATCKRVASYIAYVEDDLSMGSGMYPSSGTLHCAMADDTQETGLARLKGGQVLDFSASQLGVRNLTAVPVEAPRTKDRVYRSNDELWRALLSERVRATAVVKLEDF